MPIPTRPQPKFGWPPAAQVLDDVHLTSDPMQKGYIRQLYPSAPATVPQSKMKAGPYAAVKWINLSQVTHESVGDLVVMGTQNIYRTNP